MSEKPKSHFETLAAVNVSDKIEKKNGLSYLSWAWAVDQLFRQDPDASWEYGEPKKFGADTVMVYCTVTAFGKPRTAHLPVMNYKNQAIPDPTSFEINTALQRVLVKAIALHGLGLYIYAGEDLPETPVLSKTVAQDTLDTLIPEEDKKRLADLATVAKDFLKTGFVNEAFKVLKEANLDADQHVAIWSFFDSKERSALKKYGDSLKVAA